MKLDKKALGLTLGILWAACVLVGTLWIIFRGNGGGHLYLLRQFYPGYQVSTMGAVLGALYGFVGGFTSGWGFAWLYNKLAKK